MVNVDTASAFLRHDNALVKRVRFTLNLGNDSSILNGVYVLYRLTRLSEVCDILYKISSFTKIAALPSLLISRIGETNSF